ncbi:uncharacterized protein CANTADRAFT_32435, partial [Suhomyces tanzawaensis NRRL Y-17324]
SSYYFLLKTENIQPLIDVVDQITRQINTNQATIQRLTRYVDERVKFPELELEHTSEPAREEPTDPLRYLLKEKYSLDTMSLTKNETKELEKIANSRIRQLVLDNIKLQRIQHGNRIKNQALARVVQDYESLIVETILPPLRQELLELGDGGLDSSARHYMDVKYDKIERIYGRYVANLEALQNLTGVVERLMGFLGHDNEEYLQLYLQFVGLRHLR